MKYGNEINQKINHETKRNIVIFVIKYYREAMYIFIYLHRSKHLPFSFTQKHLIYIIHFSFEILYLDKHISRLDFSHRLLAFFFY